MAGSGTANECAPTALHGDNTSQSDDAGRQRLASKISSMKLKI